MGIAEAKARFMQTEEGIAYSQRTQLYASALTDTTWPFSPSNPIFGRDFLSQRMACIYEAKRLDIAIEGIRRSLRIDSSRVSLPIRIDSYDALPPPFRTYNTPQTTVYLTSTQNVLFTKTSSSKEFKDNRSTLYTGVLVDLERKSSQDVTVRVKHLTTRIDELLNEREKEILTLFQGQNFVPGLKETLIETEETQPNSTPTKKYISVETLHGKTMSDITYDPSSPTIPFLFFQILKIIKTFHNRGLVIRDIKPGNFYLTGEQGDEVGIRNATFVHDLKTPEKSTFIVRGYTLDYLSPESAKRLSSENKTSNLPPSDIWAAGVTLAKLLSDRPILQFLRPIDNTECLESRLQHLASLNTPPPSNPDEAPMRQLARKCLHPNPEERPTIEAVLQDPILRNSLINDRFFKFLEDQKISIDDAFS